MVRFLPQSPEEEPRREEPRPTLSALHGRLSFLDPSLEPGSVRYEAALVLIAADAIGQNVDRLARFTGVARQEVARFARRLVDNGVWQDGNTVSRWRDNPEDVECFRMDVGVADGTLCRRVGAEGELEWAPQGYWRKHFEYTDPRREALPQVVCYHPHVEVANQPLPYYAEDGSEEEGVVQDGTGWSAEVVRGEVEVETKVEGPSWLGTDPDETAAGDEVWLGSVPSVGADLFPDAAWLR